VGDDLREGPKTAPKNKLMPRGREQILETANQPEHRDLSSKQIVPLLADQGRYIASESSFYRVLRAERQLHHRERSRPAAHSRPRELAATRPNQVWSWDITYLLSPVKGAYFSLYLVLDIFSRKLVGWEVHHNESAEHAGELIAGACSREGVQRDQVALHQDNGGPMKCGTFLALLQCLGVAASFSRPNLMAGFPELHLRPNCAPISPSPGCTRDERRQAPSADGASPSAARCTRCCASTSRPSWCARTSRTAPACPAS